MRKLLMLPAIGAAAALTYGAAAALNVTGEAAPMQVVDINDLQCAEGAEVQGYGYNDHLTPPTVSYIWVDITDVNENCDGYTLYATPLDGGVASGPAVRAILGLPADGGDATDRQGNVSRYQLNFPGSGIDALNLEGIRLAIDQGIDVGPDIP